MFVDPDFAGRGVASRLLQEVEAAARICGFARIRTEASLTARPFFTKRGFSMVAAQRVEKRGRILRNFLMEKDLAGG